ncbi:MAG: PAS domain S-box protein [Candidatus Tectomicrobia bacterium]|uniref:PAS domain S-box protein n=1 Tax=Tectimicrobiota bacterium TaxID=2528274 RepID=A0A933GPI6_UNCTE|nr:PAS domain S-box protein [Candidatus Tectomicrobia bacterium]
MAVYENLTKEQLIAELTKLSQRINELEKIKAECEATHKELLKTKSTYQGLFEFAPDAIVVVNHDGLMVQVNKQAERLFGYSREELLEKPVEILMPERFRQVHVEYRKGYFAEPRLRSMGTGLGLCGKRKDGSEFFPDIALGPLEIENELFVVAIIRDITKHKLAEEAALQLSAIVNSSDDAIIGETPEGLIFSWNAGAEKVYGYSAQEVMGRSISLLIPHGWSDELPDLLEKLRGGEHVKHYETVRVKKDGQLIHVSLTLSPIIDAAGAVIGISTVARDITELKEIEEKMRREKEFSERLISSSLDGILAFDQNCRYTVWNPAMEGISGVTKEQVLDKCAFDVFPILKKAEEGQCFTEALAGRTGIIKDRPYVAPGTGREGFYEAHYSPLLNEAGAVIGGLSVIRDTTERKRAEEEIKKYASQL